MKKLIYTLAFVLSILTDSLSAQVTQEWVATYNGPGNGNDWANSLTVDGLGNVYVTGCDKGSGTDYDYVTIKYNSSGIQQWVTRYNGPGNSYDGASSIAVDASGNVYVTGGSCGIGTYSDYATIKYNSSGVQQWIQRYDGPGNLGDGAVSIAIDGSGNIYVTGKSYGIGTYSDYATIKYNPSGVQQWVARYNGPGSYYNNAVSMDIDGSGNVYVTGESYETGTTCEYATIKYNSSGIQQWVARYNGTAGLDDFARSLAADGSGNVYVTGSSEGNGSYWDYATIKYNTSGIQQWVARYNGPSNNDDLANALAVDGSGNVYVTGQSEFYSTTIKYNSSGVQQWVTRYGLEYDCSGSSCIALDGYSNVYVTGFKQDSTLNIDYATIKYNSSGVQKWAAIYDGSGNGQDEVTSIAIDGSGNVYVTGSGTVLNIGIDFETIKYSQQIGIQNISSEIPSSYSLSQNYPNPFNPTTKIQFKLPKNNYVTLKIYDALGREAATLVNEKLAPGTYEVDWNGSNYPSGVYFYRLMTDNFSETKKMLMIK